MNLSELVIKARANAQKHGWVIKDKDIPTYLMMIVSEASEAMEKWRDKKPFDEELADIVIRVAHMAGDLHIKEVDRKMAKNENRPYHNGRIRL